MYLINISNYTNTFMRANIGNIFAMIMEIEGIY